MRASVARVGWLAVLLSAFAMPCVADTVVLDNGDRLTGTIARLESGKLVFNTKYAGDIKIDLGHIRNLQSEGTMTVVLSNGQRLYGKLSGDGAEVTVQPTEQSAPEQEPLARVTDILPGVVTGREWKRSGHVNVGWSDATGNTEVSRLHADAEIVAQQGKNRYTAGFSLNQATDHGTETESNVLAYAKYDRFFSPKLYGYGNTTFEHDRFKDIRLRTTLGLGSGYQWIASSRTNFSLEGGLDYVRTNYYSAPIDQFPALRLAWKFDYYLVPEKLQFFQRTQTDVGLENLKKSFVRAQTGLRIPLTGNFIATAEYDVNWDGNPQPGTVSTDRIVLFSLGYKW